MTLLPYWAKDIGDSIFKTLGEVALFASIAVVSRDGRPLYQLTPEQARPFTAKVALQKAQQAAKTGRTTRHNAEQVAAGELTPQILDIDPDEFIKWPGGVPIYNQYGELIGGAGVSELTGDEDEEMCLTGVLVSGFIWDREQALEKRRKASS